MGVGWSHQGCTLRPIAAGTFSIDGFGAGRKRSVERGSVYWHRAGAAYLSDLVVSNRFVSFSFGLGSSGVPAPPWHAACPILAVIGKRNRIAREFHDTLLAGLSAVSWQIDAALELCGGLAVERSLKTARGMLRYCRDEARRAVGDLRDEPEPEPPVAVAIENTLKQMTEGTGVNTVFEVDDKLPAVPPELSSDLVRICQEGMRNAIRHGQASEISVWLRREDSGLTLSIEDDGIGADAELITKPPAGHLGIWVCTSGHAGLAASWLLPLVRGGEPGCT